MTTREDVVAYARSLDGLGADPADPEGRAAYLDLIAPGEQPARADALATDSGCELVQRGILRRFIRHPLLERLYVTGHAGIDLVKIAGGCAGDSTSRRSSRASGGSDSVSDCGASRD